MGTSQPRIDELQALCHRYGPGRLPRADRYEIGAGYAAAAAAFVAAVAFAAGTFVASLIGAPLTAAHPFWSGVGLVAIPFVVPAAFVAGTLVWRSLPASTPRFGAVGGVLTAVLTYALSLAAVFFVLALYAVAAGAPEGLEAAAVELAALTTLIGIVAVVFTTWLTIPAAIVGGLVYERANGRSSAE